MMMNATRFFPLMMIFLTMSRAVLSQSSIQMHTNENGAIIVKNIYKIYDLDMAKLFEKKWFTLMLRRDPREMTETIDMEACEMFSQSPSVELAGVLGLCKSERSRELLFAFKPPEKERWDNLTNLARARRGDSNMFAFVVNNLTNELSKAGLNYKAYVGLAPIVSYLGGSQCVIPFFDTIDILLHDGKRKNDQIQSFIYQTVKQAEPYFTALGCSAFPRRNENNGKVVYLDIMKFPDWWKENREILSSELSRPGFQSPFLKLGPYTIGTY